MPLKLQVVSADPLETKVDLLAVGVAEGDPAKASGLAPFHHAFGGGLAELFAREDFRGKKDQRLIVPTLGRLPADKVVFLGLGRAGAARDADLRVFAAAAGKAALADKASSLALVVPEGLAPERMRFLSEGVILGSYHFTKYFTGDRKPKRSLSRVLLVETATKKKGERGGRSSVDVGTSVGHAIALTRDLQNEPPNVLTPEALADAAVQVGKAGSLKTTVLDQRELEKAGAHLLLAVARGSSRAPRLVHLIYSPKKRAKRRIALVGKGLTFDSGGLCIKPAAGMGEMKTDMSGAANVIGVMAALPSIAPDVEVHGIIGCVENMPDGDAYRPGDVFPSMDGKTVEIINTDAEGRLVLADCLTYARKFKPDVIVNNATLTGACVVALGPSCSGFYATDDKLAASFSDAAREAGEQFWRMPLLEDLRDQLKSDCADLKHTGERYGGSITAALFLREFVGDTPFIHCDIAGPALAHRAHGIYPKGGTGHGVLTFLQFLAAYTG
ncbi:MAG: leucyl aminopeptidase [Polyangiaceae bacterium]|jgi:leucyl aminopeptidase|nr:leucyl aminopeptidase [Polyangiaceae bacterium]